MVNIRRRRILIVDDEPMVRRLYGRWLSSARFTVDEASDGFDAIRAAMLQRPDVIILDGDLPAVDGFETCRWLKTRPETQSIPIVFVTGLDEAAARAPALAAGADEFLAKPTHAQALIDRVQSALRSGLRTVAPRGPSRSSPPPDSAR